MATSKVAIVAGYGIGISAAVAKRLGAEGYKLALLARTQPRIDAAAKGKFRNIYHAHYGLNECFMQP